MLLKVVHLFSLNLGSQSCIAFPDVINVLKQNVKVIIMYYP